MYICGLNNDDQGGEARLQLKEIESMITFFLEGGEGGQWGYDKYVCFFACQDGLVSGGRG